MERESTLSSNNVSVYKSGCWRESLAGNSEYMFFIEPRFETKCQFMNAIDCVSQSPKQRIFFAQAPYYSRQAVMNVRLRGSVSEIMLPEMTSSCYIRRTALNTVFNDELWKGDTNFLLVLHRKEKRA